MLARTQIASSTGLVVISLVLFQGCASPSETGRGPLPLVLPAQEWESSRGEGGGRFHAGIGLGKFEQEVEDLPGAPGSGSKDDDDASLLRLEIEGGGDVGGVVLGGGVQIEAIAVDDLFETGGDPVEIGTFELRPHLTVMPVAGQFRIPIRLGPFVHVLQSETTVNRLETTIASYGGRIEVEPEFDFVAEKDVSFGVFGLLRGSSGTSVVDSDAGTSINGQTVFGDETYTTDMYGWGFEAGLRFKASAFSGGLAWVHRVYDVDTSDPETILGTTGVRVQGSKFTFSGLMLEAGVRW